jgi:ABC-type branched-subunit amino acid transport system substrate-binding protein
MARAALGRSRLAVLALISLGALAGCSGQTSGSGAVTVKGSSLTIYASRPPGGAGGQVASDVLDAEQLALHLSGSRVGSDTVRLVPVAGREISANARSAVSDTTAIAYLGELQPGTSQDSVSITNELDLLQVSPTDTALYLTQPSSAVPGAPGTYYPSSSSYHDTFARVVPSSSAEAHALVTQMSALHLSHLDVADDGSPYGASLAAAVRHDAASAGLTVLSGAGGADAVFYGGEPGRAMVSALNDAASASPSAKLFAPSATWFGPTTVSRLSPAAQHNLFVSTPGFTRSTLSSAGQGFETAFQSAFGHAPTPQAIFGYEAMAAVLAVLRQAGANAGNRAVVVSDFRTLHDRSSVLGTYSINGGDPSIAPFVFARVRGGQLVVPGA